jgi:hypothetical protein
VSCEAANRRFRCSFDAGARLGRQGAAGVIAVLKGRDTDAADSGGGGSVAGGDALAFRPPAEREPRRACRVEHRVFNAGEMDMEHFLHHSTRPDRTGPSLPLGQRASRIGRWLWPPAAADGFARQEEVHAAGTAQPQELGGDDAWSMHTMRWVPIAVPLAALFMLLLAVLIGSRL